MCAGCRAHKAAKRKSSLEHDIPYLARMFEACYDARSCCSATGRSLLALRKVGEVLSVDCINSRRGYVPGNVQLIALSLNTEKADQRRVPIRALNALLSKLEHVTEDRLSSETGAVRCF